MPKDKDGKFYIYPPIEPESAGLLSIFYILWHLWPAILAGLVVSGIIFGIISFTSSVFEGGAQIIKNQQTQATQAVDQANIQNGLTKFNKFRNGAQSLYLEYKTGNSQTCEDYIDIHSLEFANNGVWLYFDAAIIDDYISVDKGAWLTWSTDQLKLDDGAGIKPVSGQVFTLLPDTQCNSLKVKHYTGFLVFPYSKIFDQDVGNGILYFAHDKFYPLVDLKQSENWVIVPTSLSNYKMGISTRELGIGGNSNLMLNEIEANSKTGRVTLSLTIAVDPNSNGYQVNKPNQVYVLAGSHKFPASRWNGVFDSHGDGSFYGLAWTGFESKSGAIQFDGAWDDIKSTNCFDFYYGDAYAFQNICIPK